MWVIPTLPFQHCSLAPTGDAPCSCSIYLQAKLPYPSACCVHCSIPVSGTRGTREQHQVLTVVGGHLVTSYQIVAGCREYFWSCAGNSKSRCNWKKSRLCWHRSSRHPKSWEDLRQDAPSHFGSALMTKIVQFVDTPWKQCHLQSQLPNCRSMQSWRDRQSTGEIRYSSSQRNEVKP